MITFVQFLEAIKHQEFPEDPSTNPYLSQEKLKLRDVLSRFTDPRDILRLLLSCISEIENKLSPQANEVLKDVKTYLTTKDENIRLKLRDGLPEFHGNFANNAAFSIGRLLRYDQVNSSLISSSILTLDTISDAVRQKSIITSRDFTQKEDILKRYVNIAKSFLSSTDAKGYSHFMKKPDELAIMALLDKAEEENEDILVQKGNELVLNAPGHLLKASNKQELAKKIVGNQWAINYLQQLYGEK